VINTRLLRVLRVAAVLAVVALGLIVWSLLQPHPIPVIIAMSVGQVLGTLSFAAFLYVVIADFRNPAKPQRRSTDPPGARK
jgi:hypothetical protein